MMLLKVLISVVLNRRLVMIGALVSALVSMSHYSSFFFFFILLQHRVSYPRDVDVQLSRQRFGNRPGGLGFPLFCIIIHFCFHTISPCSILACLTTS